MDFSSADVPISRETWAPRSPVRAQAPITPTMSNPAGATSSSSDPHHAESSSDPYDNSARRYDDDEPNAARRAPGSDNGPDSYVPARSGSAPYVPPYRQGYRADRPDDAPMPRRPPPTAPTVPVSNVLGVFGLSVRTRERDLEDEFGKYGDVEKVIIVYDQRTDRSRGFGFITMRKDEHATNAIKHLNGYNLHGRNIRVDYSATQKAHNPTPGQYMGEKKPLYGQDDRFRGRYDRGSDRYDRDRYDDRDDRRGGRYDREDRRDRYDDRDRDFRPRRDYDDPYGGRSRRDDDRRRSPSPRRAARYASPERRPPTEAAARY